MAAPDTTSPSPVHRHWPPLLVVGLTGGIASGKSTVARMFRELGATILNADDAGRAVVQPGEPALAEVIAAFGPEYLLPDGTLHRKALGQRVFSRSDDLQTLNRITHPRIAEYLSRQLRQLAANPPNPPIVILEAAILLEAGWDRFVDRIAVVVAQHSTQVERLIAGHALSVAEAEARIQAQLSSASRLAAADYVIDGDTELHHTQAQVAAIWQRLVLQVQE